MAWQLKEQPTVLNEFKQLRTPQFYTSSLQSQTSLLHRTPAGANPTKLPAIQFLEAELTWRGNKCKSHDIYCLDLYWKCPVRRKKPPSPWCFKFCLNLLLIMASSLYISMSCTLSTILLLFTLLAFLWEDQVERFLFLYLEKTKSWILITITGDANRSWGSTGFSEPMRQALIGGDTFIFPKVKRTS